MPTNLSKQQKADANVPAFVSLGTTKTDGGSRNMAVRGGLNCQNIAHEVGLVVEAIEAVP